MTVRRALRLRPTLAGALTAIACGSLVSGGICAARPAPAAIEPVLMVLAQWAFVAGCVFAANQAWVDRDRRERFEIFVVCLVVALPILVVMWIATANVYVGLGGRP